MTSGAQAWPGSGDLGPEPCSNTDLWPWALMALGLRSMLRWFFFVSSTLTKGAKQQPGALNLFMNVIDYFSSWGDRAYTKDAMGE